MPEPHPFGPPNKPVVCLKLGRKCVKTDSRTLCLGKYFTGALPAPPATADWTKGITRFGEMLNDSLGDCTCAGLGHAVQIWSANTGGEATVPDRAVLSAYESWCGYDPSDSSTDQGGNELDVLTDFKRDGLGGHKLLAFADPAASNLTEIRQTIALFGGAYIGMNVPNFIMDDVPQVWDVTADDRGIDGGHAVFVTGYDDTTFTFISWGSLYKMTLPYWSKYVDEAHALIGADWFETSGVDPTGLNLAQLKTDLAAIR